MEMINLLIWLINLIQKFGVFEANDFEYFEVDQRPGFYLGVFTLRPKEE